MNRVIKTAVTILVAAGFIFAASASAAERKATTFRLKDVNGRSYDLKKSLGDRVIVLSFWATWCAPCQAEMAALNEIHEKYKDDGLEVLAISVDDPKSVAQVKPTVKRQGYGFKVLLDTQSRVITMYNPKKAVPFTAMIDKEGKVVHERIGYEPGAEKELEKEIRVLLGLDDDDESTADEPVESDS